METDQHKQWLRGLPKNTNVGVVLMSGPFSPPTVSQIESFTKARDLILEKFGFDECAGIMLLDDTVGIDCAEPMSDRLSMAKLATEPHAWLGVHTSPTLGVMLETQFPHLRFTKFTLEVDANVIINEKKWVHATPEHRMMSLCEPGSTGRVLAAMKASGIDVNINNQPSSFIIGPEVAQISNALIAQTRPSGDYEALVSLVPTKVARWMLAKDGHEWVLNGLDRFKLCCGEQRIIKFNGCVGHLMFPKTTHTSAGKPSKEMKMEKKTMQKKKKEMEKKIKKKWSCVILAHGLCCLQSFEPIPTMVEALLTAGIACLTFDYRGFGESDNVEDDSNTTSTQRTKVPSQYIDPKLQQADWLNALVYTSSLLEIVTTKIGVWGTSFSGGHVVHLASHLPNDVNICCAVSQVGCMDYNASRAPIGITMSGFIMRLALSKIRLGQKEITLCGKPGDVAICDGLTEYNEILALTETKPTHVHWRNKTPLRSLVKSSGYKPLSWASDIKCPIFFISAENDRVTPPEFIRQASEQAPQSEFFEVPNQGHSEIYFGDWLERIVEMETKYFLKHFGEISPPDCNSHNTSTTTINTTINTDNNTVNQTTTNDNDNDFNSDSDSDYVTNSSSTTTTTTNNNNNNNNNNNTNNNPNNNTTNNTTNNTNNTTPGKSKFKEESLV